MDKVIETQISLDGNEEFVDHQSRVIQVDSWDDFVEEIKSAKVITRQSFLGNMMGVSVPKNAGISEFKSDNKHLSCKVETYDGKKVIKLAYKI